MRPHDLPGIAHEKRAESISSSQRSQRAATLANERTATARVERISA
jgi:hypothetical protein